MKNLIPVLSVLALFAVPVTGQTHRTLEIITPGTLSEVLTSEEKSAITHFTVTGTIDSTDFNTMKDDMPELRFLDLSGASTVNNALYQLALAYKNTLDTILLPHSITRIGQEALMDCPIKEIIIPPTVTLIEHAAFRYCPLEEITIPASVKSIGPTVFSSCYSLKAIYVEEDNSAYCSVDSVLFSKDTTLLVACPPGKTGKYIIPSKVTEIDYEGFSSCEKIDSLFIPASVMKTGELSFTSCTLLTDFQVEESSAYLTDIDGVLYTRDLSTLLRYPINKPDTSCSVAHGTKIIGSFAFQNCKHLTRVLLPETLIDIKNSAFRFCTEINTLELPPSVKTIDNAALYYCSSLRSIRIPSSVSFLGNVFLHGAEELDTLMVNSSVPVELYPWRTYFIGIDTSNCILLVPSGSSDAYRNSIHWKSFVNIEEYDLSFDVSQTEFSSETAGGIATLVITSNTEWRIASDEPWITISDTLGMNSKTITLTVAANALSGRQGIVHINPLGASPVNVTIAQSGLPTAINQAYHDPVRIYLAKNLLYVYGAKDGTLQILAIDGRLLISKRITADRETLPVDSLPEGIYLVKAGKTCIKLVR